MSHSFVAMNWKPLRKGSLVGFVSVSMPSGITVHEVSILETNGRFWASPPSKPMIDRNGVVMIDDAGKRRYSALIEFVDRDTRSRWSNAVIEALRTAEPEALLAQPAPAEPPPAAAWEAPGDEIPF